MDMRQAAAADAMMPAGKSTRLQNASFSALDYHPAKLDGGRSFLMDDYTISGRMARARNPIEHESCWDVMQYQKDITPFQPKQGFSETKFHSGFMRRQASQMPYLTERVRKRAPPMFFSSGRVLLPRRARAVVFFFGARAARPRACLPR